MSDFSTAAQDAWSLEMRERVPRPAGQQWHTPLTILSDLSAEILGKKVHHFRGLTAEEAQTVLDVIRRRHPGRRDETLEVWDEQRHSYVPKRKDDLSE